MNEDEYSQDAASIDWQSWRPSMRATLLFLHRGRDVLLIHKKSGLGCGKINPRGENRKWGSASEAAVRRFQRRWGLVLEIGGDGRIAFSIYSWERLALHCVVFRAFEFTARHTKLLRLTLFGALLTIFLTIKCGA